MEDRLNPEAVLTSGQGQARTRRIRVRVATALAAALLPLVPLPGNVPAAGLTMHTAAAPSLVPADTAIPLCEPSPVARGAAFTRRPVVLVHGWNSGPTMWDSTIRQLEAMPQIGGDRYEFLQFDYAPLTAHWPNDADIHQCLARVFTDASRAYERGGGDGRVLAVGHSMGGIAIRYAAHDTVDGVPVGEILAGVVTLGTPHLGSPWGGTVLSRALQTTSQSWASGFAREFPPAGSDAQTCLAQPLRRPSSCGTTPYLPQGVPLAEIGTQIIIERTLFDVGLFRGPTAALYLFGDGVVAADSATGYIGSGPGGPNHSLPYRATVQPNIVDCTYTTDYLTTRWGARLGSRFGPIGTIIGTLGGTLAGEAVDTAAADRLLTGEPSLALAELTYYASRTPCFHTNLAQHPEALGITADALQEFGATRTPPPATTLGALDGRSVWTVTDYYGLDCADCDGLSVLQRVSEREFRWTDLTLYVTGSRSVYCTPIRLTDGHWVDEGSRNWTLRSGVQHLRSTGTAGSGEDKSVYWVEYEPAPEDAVNRFLAESPPDVVEGYRGCVR